MAIIEGTYTVGYREIDRNFEISNRAILGFMEDVAGKHSASVGLGALDIPETNLSWILLNWKLQVFKRVKYGEKIIIKTWSKRSTKLYSYRDFKAFNENGDLVAIASSKWILFNVSTAKICKLSEELMKPFDAVADLKVFDEEDLVKIEDPGNYISSIDYTVQRRDIDINMHVHNIYYLDIANETIPLDVFMNSSFSKLDIMYKTEIKYGETVKCLYCSNADGVFVVIRSLDLSKLHAIIRFNS